MSTNPILSLIVAKSKNGVIGVDGDLPWRLSSDLKHFKAVTLGKPCLMGRVTWDSLPFPLPGRPNLVLTRNPNFKAKSCEVFTDMYDMVGRGFELAGATGADEIMIIGGAKLYSNLMPYVQRMYVTDVDEIIDGDAHFPAIMATDWTRISSIPMARGEKDDYAFSITVYERAQ